MTGNCEWVRPADLTLCGHRASFLVGIGTRKSDRQRACAMHLASVVIAFDGAEGRNGQHVTVQWFPVTTEVPLPEG